MISHEAFTHEGLYLVFEFHTTARLICSFLAIVESPCNRLPNALP